MNQSYSSFSSVHSVRPVQQGMPINLSQLSFLSASTIPPDMSFNFDQLERDAHRIEGLVSTNPYEAQETQGQYNHSRIAPPQQYIPPQIQQPQQQQYYQMYAVPQEYILQQQQQQQYPQYQNNYSMINTTQQIPPHPVQVQQQFYQQPDYNIPSQYHQQQLQQQQQRQQQLDQQQYENYMAQQLDAPNTTNNNSTKSECSDNIPEDKQKKITVPKEFKLSERKGSKTVKLKKELEEALKTECTFKPKINNYSGTRRELDREDRLKALAANKRDEYQRREQERLKQEQDELKKFKFQPNPSRKLDAEKAQAVTDRLMREAESRVAKREKAKREREMAEMSEHLFAPKTYSKLPENYVPVYEKIEELQRKKEEKLKELRIREAQKCQETMTFEPQICQNSERIANMIKGGKRNKKKIRTTIPSDEELNCTFHPSVNPKSEELLAHAKLYTTEDFVKRQEILNQKDQRKKEILKEKENMNMQFPFKPTINRTSQMIVDSNIQRASENVGEKIERLAIKDKQKREVLQQVVQTQYYQQFKFEPELNPISKNFGQASNVTDYQLFEERKKRKLDLIHKEEYDFKPKLVTTVSDAQSRYLDPADQERKKMKIAIAQQLQEQHEAKACTFIPVTNKGVPEDLTGPVVIKGLGNHLDRIDKAKRIEMEKRLAEENAFKIRSIAQDMDLPYTIPEPFNLSSHRRSFFM